MSLSCLAPYLCSKTARSSLPASLQRCNTARCSWALNLQGELEGNLKSLSPPDFEQVLRPLFQEDEKTLIAVGAALGGVAGLIQWLIVAAH